MSTPCKVCSGDPAIIRLDWHEHTLQSVLMQPDAPLQPTLWRTCRAIANQSRLRLFGLLVQKPGQTVSAAAEQLNLPPAVASQSLRLLEARGLLTVRRAGRWVKYRPRAANRSNDSELAAALSKAFRREAEPVESVFKLATAFTHPRRIEIYRLLHRQPCTTGQLRAATRFSSWALLRHLRKLEDRGFIAQQGRKYVSVKHPKEFGRQLARMAIQ